MNTGITRSMSSSLVFFIAPVFLLSCPDRAAKAPPDKVETATVRVNQEFNLRVGQEATVAGEKLKVKFVSVANDSRCPKDVTCVWAGNAEVLIQADSNGKTADLKLNTMGAANFPKEAKHLGYTIVLIKLSPQPSKDKGIKPGDYEATLLIRKE